MLDFSKTKIYTEIEKYESGAKYRSDYVESLDKLVKKMRDDARSKRLAHMSPEALAKNREDFRREYIEMLGYPLTEYREGMEIPAFTKEFVAKDDMCSIYRMQIETLPDFKFYGMLFVPNTVDENGKEKAPLVITQHGGGGTPELCSDIYGENNYNQLVRRCVDRGAVCFAPQILLWQDKFCPEKPDRASIDKNLKQLGGSITALEIYCIRRSLDLLCTFPMVDTERIGMTGLSYGGFYTLVTGAAETRIKSSYSIAYFNDMFRYAWYDFTWFNSGNRFTNPEIAALHAPRRLLVEVGKEDKIFEIDTAYAPAEDVPKYFEAQGAADNFFFHPWDGGHKPDTEDGSLDYFFEGLK